jgi:hypothetical protein
MLTAAVLSTAILAQTGAENPVNKMLARYANAKQIVGTIEMRQITDGAEYRVLTRVQYERPRKLYIYQVDSRNKQWKVVSDGVWFTYDTPNHFDDISRKRLYETINRRGLLLNIGDVYATASQSLGDRSAPLDLIIGRTVHVRNVVNQWATREYDDEGIVRGDFREYGNAKVSGKYAMRIGGEGDLSFYALNESVFFKEEGRPRNIRTEWKIDLETGKSGDESLYKVTPPRR